MTSTITTAQLARQKVPMKRNLKLTFTDETDWSTTLEAFRRLRKEFFEEQLSDAQLVTVLCREYLDNPKPQSGKEKP